MTYLHQMYIYDTSYICTYSFGCVRHMCIGLFYGGAPINTVGLDVAPRLGDWFAAPTGWFSLYTGTLIPWCLWCPPWQWICCKGLIFICLVGGSHSLLDGYIKPSRVGLLVGNGYMSDAIRFQPRNYCVLGLNIHPITVYLCQGFSRRFYCIDKLDILS